jgi:hypothetical protein
LSHNRKFLHYGDFETIGNGRIDLDSLPGKGSDPLCSFTLIEPVC